ncbi:MAG TPA: ADP-ribosylglycohydrolase family protein [Allocoleopsis sp.]
MSNKSVILSGLMGVCVGDSLGVPVEFTTRKQREQSPVTTMIGYGTYNQPPGTWSDDSSLTFCLAESLCNGFNLDDIGRKFCQWYDDNLWTPYGKVFDIGITTSRAIFNLKNGVNPLESGGKDDHSNGNGSLMRILPIVYDYKSLSFPELINRVHQVSSITHGHAIAQMCCGIYISMAVCLLEGMSLEESYLQCLKNVTEIYERKPFNSYLNNLERILSGNIHKLPVNEIESGGYVIHSLEAALWCLLNSKSYAETVLKAVNLGGDTDTTGAIAGGLAGIYYGFDQIPLEWINQIVRKDDIIDLAQRLELAII